MHQGGKGNPPHKDGNEAPKVETNVQQKPKDKDLPDLPE